jgi:hypothetical protein
MRCYLGKKKIERLKRLTGLPIIDASVRGNEGHSYRVLLEDKTVCQVYPDGEIYNSDAVLIGNYKNKGGDSNGLQGKEDGQGDQEVTEIPSSKGEG